MKGMGYNSHYKKSGDKKKSYSSKGSYGKYGRWDSGGGMPMASPQMKFKAAKPLLNSK